MVKVTFERVHSGAHLPTKATEHAACWDVYAAEDCIVAFGDITVTTTGLKIKVPHGYEVVVRPRSGLAFKEGITIVNSPGTIDSDYRGELKIVLTRNIAKGYYTIKAGERIAQIKVQKVYDWEPIWGEVIEDTERGSGGFGSTGK